MGITRSKRMDQPSKVANAARGQLNREMNTSLSVFAPENLVSRDGFGSPVPRQPAHLHTQAELAAVCCQRVCFKFGVLRWFYVANLFVLNLVCFVCRGALTFPPLQE